MLRLSDDFRCLLHLSVDARHRQIAASVPEMPIAPFAYVVLGRLSSLQRIDNWPQLHTSMQAVSVKTAMKKISNQPRSQLVDVDRAAVEAENPPYLQEMAQYMKDHPHQRCRYLIIEDALHANSISRFHFVFKRELVEASNNHNHMTDDVPHASATNQVAAAAAAGSNTPSNTEPSSAAAATSSSAAAAANAASSSANPASLSASFAASLKDATTATYKYYVMDLGSLNGMYINGDKTRSQVWLPLSEGDKLRFAPLTRASRMYASKLTEVKADARNRPPTESPFADNAVDPSTPQPILISNSALAHSSDFARMNSIFEQVRVSAVRSNLPAVNSKDIHIEFVFSQRITQRCIERDLTQSRVPVDNSANQWRTNVPPPARPPHSIEQFDANGRPVPSNQHSSIPVVPPPPPAAVPQPQVLTAEVRVKPEAVEAAAPMSDIHPANSNSAAAAISSSPVAAVAGVFTPAPLLDDEDEVLEVPPFATSAAAATRSTQRKRKAEEAHGNSQSSLSQSQSQSQSQQQVNLRVNNDLLQPDSKRLRTSGDAARASTPRQVVEIDDEENVPLAILKRKSSSNPPANAAAASSSSTTVIPAAASSASAMDTSNAGAASNVAAPPSSAAAAAASSSSSASATAAAAPVNARMTSLLDEFNCGICSDIIYKNVVLDCSHSFCRGCIETWFKKKKICPICREKHKGAPRAVRSADNVIAQLVEFALTDEEKKERSERIRISDLEWKEREDKKEERARMRASRKAGAVASSSAADPADRLQNVLQQMMARHNAVNDRMARSAFLFDDEDLDYDDDELDEDEEEDPNEVMILPPRLAAPRRNVLPPPPPPPPSFNYVVDVTRDRTTACRICCALIEPNLLRLKRTPTSGGTPQHFHLSCYRNDRTGNYPAFGVHQLHGVGAVPSEHVGRLNELMTGRRS